MVKHNNLPFKVGQLAESKSFVTGFRGAWFRCKIKDIKPKGVHPVHALEYYDFPDEKIKWTRIYQKPPKRSDEMEKERELMVRPHYPRIYTENACPNLEMISEPIVITDRAWKVGDLVDWLSDGCFWSGKVFEIVDDDMVKVELPEPPIGEGSSYEVISKDLRPSLDWSPGLGWTVPTSLGHEEGRTCARLIKPVGQGSSTGPSSTSQHSKKEDLVKQSIIASGNEIQDSPGTNIDMDISYSDSVKVCCSGSVSSRYVGDSSAEAAGTASEEEQDCDIGSSKKIRLDESISLNSTSSDTIESYILDFEELVNKVKWTKRILEYGIPSQDSGQPTWKFLEHLAISTPK
ncbi:hypothetical protein Dimus_028741 [Dionaea muscipula]